MKEDELWETEHKLTGAQRRRWRETERKLTGAQRRELAMQIWRYRKRIAATKKFYAEVYDEWRAARGDSRAASDLTAHDDWERALDAQAEEAAARRRSTYPSIEDRLADKEEIERERREATRGARIGMAVVLGCVVADAFALWLLWRLLLRT